MEPSFKKPKVKKSILPWKIRQNLRSELTEYCK